MNVKKLRKVADKATPGPWEVGDHWHIQGASHCTCADNYGPLIQKRRTDINGEMMLAHYHRAEKPWYDHGIYQESGRYMIVNTVSEYGHPSRADEEFIATFNPALVTELLDYIEELEKRIND